MYFVLSYDVVDDFVERRAPFREEHLRHANQAHARGELVLAGAFTDPADKAVLVFKAEERTAAEKFAESDPYVANGLVREWCVREWNVVIGGNAET